MLDRALAGPLPEELARSLVRHRVLERVVRELAATRRARSADRGVAGQPADDRAHRPGARERGDAADAPERRLAAPSCEPPWPSSRPASPRTSSPERGAPPTRLDARVGRSRSKRHAGCGDARRCARVRLPRGARHLRHRKRRRRADRVARRRDPAAVARRVAPRSRPGSSSWAATSRSSGARPARHRGCG